MISLFSDNGHHKSAATLPLAAPHAVDLKKYYKDDEIVGSLKSIST